MKLLHIKLILADLNRIPGYDRAVSVRRKGSDWYVAGINAFADKNQTYALKLDFITEGEYEAFICRDDIDGETYRIKNVSLAVVKNDVLNMEMFPSGGFIIRLTEK